MAPTLGQISLLEANAVRPATATDYQRRLQQLEDWAREYQIEVDFDNVEATQRLLLEYFDHLALEVGANSGEGSKLLAAVSHFHPQYQRGVRRGPLHRLERALRGWEKILPNGSIDALAEPVVYAVAMEMCSRGFYNMGLRTILAVDSYLRPGVLSDLRKENLIPPQPFLGEGGKHWSLHLHRLVDREPSKVGTYDDSVILDSVERQWMNPLLGQLHRRLQSNESLWEQSMDEWTKEFRRALRRLKQPETVLYSLRHSGPTIDVLNHRRTLDQVKRRGGWAADSSVRRYEKASKALALGQHVKGELRGHVIKCLKRLPRVLGRLEGPISFVGS
jgi:hypothetical protein